MSDEMFQCPVRYTIDHVRRTLTLEFATPEGVVAMELAADGARLLADGLLRAADLIDRGVPVFEGCKN
jgi:hypothetical protein